LQECAGLPQFPRDEIREQVSRSNFIFSAKDGFPGIQFRPPNIPRAVEDGTFIDRRLTATQRGEAVKKWDWAPENLTCRVRSSCRRQTADGRIPTLWRAQLPLIAKFPDMI
jgi:hypothetical protein